MYEGRTIELVAHLESILRRVRGAEGRDAVRNRESV